MKNTMERHLEILDCAKRAIEDNGGVEAIDALPPDERVPLLRTMGKEVAEVANCHIDSAKRNVAKAMRRARYAVLNPQSDNSDNWGGVRSGSGRPPGSVEQMKIINAAHKKPGPTGQGEK